MKKKIFFLLGCLFITTMILAENTKTISVTFSDFSKGVQYAENEKHDLGNGLIIYTTKCYFTTELRIYGNYPKGIVISDPLPGNIKSMSFNAGNEKDVLYIYGSIDKENWTLIKELKISSESYMNYTLNFPTDSNFSCFKLSVKGLNQVRLKSMSVTYVDNNNENDDEEINAISAPIFNPGTSTFSTETLNVTISVAAGCDVYYTTDGTTPSYTDIQTFNGIKGNAVTIPASESSVTLKAIAVNSTTGNCSNVSSATYTYVSIKNDGSKSKPYTVAEVKNMAANKSNMWVQGTIYGTTIDTDINKGIAISSPDFKDWNIVIGNELVHIPIQLPSGDIRNKINLKNHPYLKGKEILIQGNLELYCGSQGVKEPAKYEITYTIPINRYGYATLFLDMPVSMPAGNTAYYCITDGSQANLYPVGTIIPANVGVIIESTPNSTCTLTYTTDINPNEESIRNHNQLKGFVEDTDITTDSEVYYALNAKDDIVGFYIPQTATDRGFTAKANKAYLQITPEQKVAKFIIHHDNDETTIAPTAHTYKDILYDLQGRVVASPAPGIYIREGKKIVIK